MDLGAVGSVRILCKIEPELGTAERWKCIPDSNSYIEYGLGMGYLGEIYVYIYQ